MVIQPLAWAGEEYRDRPSRAHCGPAEEIKSVKAVFRLYAIDHRSPADIAQIPKQTRDSV
jgi:hypothetical protein